MKIFTFFWLDGKVNVLAGETPANALNEAGFGGGALSALDFYVEGDSEAEYVWENRRWIKK